MFSLYSCFKNIIQGEDGNWRIRGIEGKVGMVYSVKAKKNSKQLLIR